jgi:hypothetical protein
MMQRGKSTPKHWAFVCQTIKILESDGTNDHMPDIVTCFFHASQVSSHAHSPIVTVQAHTSCMMLRTHASHTLPHTPGNSHCGLVVFYLYVTRVLLQYLVRKGIHSRVLDMGDAIFANDYAAVMSEVGVREAVSRTESMYQSSSLSSSLSLSLS